MKHLQNKPNTTTTQHSTTNTQDKQEETHMQHTLRQQRYLATPKLETHTKHQKTTAATHINKKNKKFFQHAAIVKSYL